MRRVFADTLYWIARTSQRDSWHVPAAKARQRLGVIRLITSDEVLIEFLSAFASAGTHYRLQAALTVQDILTDENVTVLPQSHASFIEGLEFYKNRPDKGYSLTDCSSMIACRHEGITDILTNDHHFTQEGFVVLITR